MKKVIVMAIAALALVACKDGSKTASDTDNARIDSLQRVIDQKDNEINDVMATFNEIQEGFRLIEAAEQNVTIAKDGESTNRHEQIRNSIRNIQERMQHNRDLIAKLQQQVREGSTRSEEMKRTIENFVKELETKNAELTQLREELQKKDIHIAELDKTVSDLNTNVASLKEDVSSKQQTISSQDAQLNTAYYVFGTKKELKNHDLYRRGKVQISSSNKDFFTKIDIRTEKEIKLHSKKAELLTTHPMGSYTLQQDAQKEYVLRITDINAFWSTSKYLVLLVK